jgi:hypothetical protein
LSTCGGSRDELNACVEDVCAAARAGVRDPERAADGYCDEVDEPDNTTNTTTNTTTGLFELCSNRTGLDFQDFIYPSYKVSFPDDYLGWPTCAIHATAQQCEEFANQHKQVSTSPVSWGGTLDVIYLAHGCIVEIKLGMWTGEETSRIYYFNINGDHPIFWKMEDSHKNYHSYCCGGSGFLFNTTTTTSAGNWIPFIGPAQDKPPLRPLSPSPSPEPERPADPQIHKCKVYRDPHIMSWTGNIDGFFGFGNYWLVNSKTVWIQGHLASIFTHYPAWTSLTKIAIGGTFLEGNTVMIETSTLWFNDEAIRMTRGQPKMGTFMDGAVNYDWDLSGHVEITFPHEVTVVLRVHPNDNGLWLVSWMSATITKSDEIGQDGLCGRIDSSATSSVAHWRRTVEELDSAQALIPH